MNCKTIRPLLSEYVDNALSARDTWEVDRHLAGCNACAGALNELRVTVRLLCEAPRFEVSDDFMAKLNARIAATEPETAPSAWRANLRMVFRPRILPAWGAAACGCALALIAFTQRVPTEVSIPEPHLPAPAAPTLAQTARNQSVALAATNPLGDPAAAALIASNASDSGETPAVP